MLILVPWPFFVLSRVQRKSVSQPAIWAGCSQHLLAHKSFQLAPKPILISRTCPLRTKITSPMAKSSSPGLSDTTFFARWFGFHWICYEHGGRPFVFVNRESEIFELIGKPCQTLRADFGPLSASCPIFWPKGRGSTLTLQWLDVINLDWSLWCRYVLSL